MDCKEEALRIMPYAIEFYGSKYKHIIEEVLDHTEFKILDDDANKHRQGGYFYKIIGMDFTHEIAMRNIEDPLYRQAILTHELFGHAVLSHEQPFTKIDGTLYIRNGICLRKCFGDEKSINLMANEGMVEYIASHIMKLYEPSYKIRSKLFINEINSMFNLDTSIFITSCSVFSMFNSFSIIIVSDSSI